MERSRHWDKMVDILDKHFPKGECKERGAALMVLTDTELMLQKDSVTCVHCSTYRKTANNGARYLCNHFSEYCKECEDWMRGKN